MSGFLFYKQKTAYEMRISDWSSDVCSSDLTKAHSGSAQTKMRMAGATRMRSFAATLGSGPRSAAKTATSAATRMHGPTPKTIAVRSAAAASAPLADCGRAEERREGKE